MSNSRSRITCGQCLATGSSICICNLGPDEKCRCFEPLPEAERRSLSTTEQCCWCGEGNPGKIGEKCPNCGAEVPFVMIRPNGNRCGICEANSGELCQC